eukprot:TRINITY_DN6667_c0_g1_i12.p1 TRINITY_DN6667_c0_g1~~TRINITY_DN6667_c0_g1_i12.p1  ORF type:complete len:471 (-),score=84.50 TRINITY_DN6667_c0_g1_i12:87-1499(-)
MCIRDRYGGLNNQVRRNHQNVPAHPTILNAKSSLEAMLGRPDIFSKNFENGSHDGEASSYSRGRTQREPSEIESNFSRLASTLVDVFASLRNVLGKDTMTDLRKLNIPIDESPREKLSKMDPVALALSMKETIVFLARRKEMAEAELKSKTDRECSEYESHLQKLEAEVRQHIRVEQQLKLFAETTQSKLDEALKKSEDTRKERDEFCKKNEELVEQLRMKVSEVDAQKREVENLRARIGASERAASQQQAEKISMNAPLQLQDGGRAKTKLYNLPREVTVSQPQIASYGVQHKAESSGAYPKEDAVNQGIAIQLQQQQQYVANSFSRPPIEATHRRYSSRVESDFATNQLANGGPKMAPTHERRNSHLDSSRERERLIQESLNSVRMVQVSGSRSQSMDMLNPPRYHVNLGQNAHQTNSPISYVSVVNGSHGQQAYVQNRRESRGPVNTYQTATVVNLLGAGSSHTLKY